MKKLLLTTLLSLGFAMPISAQDTTDMVQTTAAPEVSYILRVAREAKLEDGTIETKFVPIAEDHVVPGDVIENQIAVRNETSETLERFALQFDPPTVMELDFTSFEQLDGQVFVLPVATEDGQTPEWVPMFTRVDDVLTPTVPANEIASIRIAMGAIAAGETQALRYLARLR